MTTILQGNDLRTLNLGRRVQKATGTITVSTFPLFTITGLVGVTSIVGRVTTAITVAGTTKLQHNPTLGATIDLCTAADLGTTDTVVGEILVPKKGSAIAIGALDLSLYPLVMDTGQIEMVTATGADGAILWALTYVPIDDGANVVAA